jgi:hypothetical protein
MQFRIGHLEDEIMEGGELLRPFGPGQIAFHLTQVVGAFNAPLSQKELEFWARNAGEFGRFAESAADGGRWISCKTLSGTSNVSVTPKQ